MESNETATPSPAGRKIRRLAIAVAIIVILYSAGWFYVASKFEAFLGTFLSPASPAPVAMSCDDLATGGFPFLIGFTCDRTRADDTAGGTTLSAGAFRLAARIYNPGTALAELEGPATVTFRDGTKIDATWSLLRSSLRAGFSSLHNLSLESKDPSVTLDSPQLFSPFAFKASELQIHTRDHDGDLDLAALARDFAWKDAAGNAILPMLSTSVELTLAGKGGLLAGQPLVGKAMKGRLNEFRIEAPGGIYGELSGPFEIDEEGYISGKFKTTLEKIDLWDSGLRTIFPEAADTISGMAALLKGLAKGEDKVTVTLKVNRGRISLSLLPLGEIPPL